jgi:predicted DNA binding CopG/RHH family protein
MKPRLPHLTTDEAAEAFLEDADLSTYDLSAMTLHSFEFAPKSRQVNLRFPEPLLAAVKARAAAAGMSYQKFIRLTLEAALRTPGPGASRP